MTGDRQLWVLAGGDGAGKSTFYQRFLASTGLPLVNADILAKELNAAYPEAASYRAAFLAGKLRKQLVNSGASFCFETVFSHPSKIDFLADAKSHGYEIILVYIHLQTVELNQARVAQRAMQGGHNVPTDKIISRIPRTMRHIKNALPLVNVAKFYDNSSQARPFLSVALLLQGRLAIEVEALPEWAKEMLVGYC